MLLTQELRIVVASKVAETVVASKVAETVAALEVGAAVAEGDNLSFINR
jgi:hypothetical protein